jgi:hypothetical protein
MRNKENCLLFGTYEFEFLRPEVLMVVTMKTFWDMMLCSSVEYC